MENTNFMRCDLDDVVFEYRNRQYGAYLLRKGYGDNIKKASFWGSTVFLFMLISPLIKEKMQGDKEDINMTNVILNPPPKTEVKKVYTPPPPEPPKPEPKKIATTAFTPPKIKEDEQVKEPENIPKVDEITTAVANKTQDGDKGDLPPVVETPAPPIEVPPVEEQKVEDTNNVFDLVGVQQVPLYPDGEMAMYKFLRDNIKYPPSAREMNVDGTVFVSFLIWKDGSIRDVKVKRGKGFGLDEEAARVIKLMPNWKPGMQNGKPVSVSYTLPIKFKLE